MRAGALKYKLRILKPTYTEDRMGAKKPTYTATRTVWAERVNTSGRRSEEVGEHFADYSAQFNVRDAHPIEENWRVQQIGGYLYAVTAIIPNRDKGMNTLICERVNE